MNDASQPQDVGKPGSTAQKKVSLDSLDREELLKKCKSLLTISQKAKQAKDDAVEQVKQIKQELNARCQESERLKADNDKFKLLVKSITEEKESVLLAIENVKSNNLELQNIVRSINAERDSFLQDATQLNVEKQKLIKVVDMMGRENDATMTENNALKEEKHRLKEEVYTLISERETIDSEIKDVKRQLVYLLNNSFAILKEYDIDTVSSENLEADTGNKYTGVLSDLISKCNKNLKNMLDAASESAIKSKIVDKCETSIATENSVTREKYFNMQSTLNAEIEHFKKLLTDVEPQLEELKKKNAVLNDELATLKSHTNEANSLFIHDYNQQQTELMNEIEKCRKSLSEKSIEMEHLKDEIRELMEKNKKQTFNAMEMLGVKGENENLQIILEERGNEIVSLKASIAEVSTSNSKLLLEIESSQKIIADHELEVVRIKEEQTASGNRIMMLEEELSTARNCAQTSKASSAQIDVLKDEISNCKRALEESEGKIVTLQAKNREFGANVEQCSSVITSLQNEKSDLQELIADREMQIETMKQRETETSESNLKSSSEIEEQSHEIAKLRQLLEERNFELCALQEASLEIETKLKMYSSQIDTLTNEVFNAQDIMPTTKSESEESTLVRQVEAPVVQLETILPKCLSNIQNFKIELENCKISLGDRENEIAFLQQEKLDCEDKIIQYESGIELLQNGLLCLQKVVPLIAVEADEESSEDSTKATKLSDVHGCLCIIGATKRGIEQLQKILDDKESTISKMKEESLENELKIVDYVKEVASLQDEIEKYERSLIDQENSKELKSEISKLQKVVEDKELEIETMIEKRREIDAKVCRDSEAMQKLSSDMMNLQQVFEDNEREITKMREQRGDIHTDVAKYLSEIEKQKSDISKLQSEIASRDDEISKTQNASVENDSKLSKYLSDIEALRNDMAALQKLAEDKEEELELAKLTLTKSETELRGEIQHLQRTVEIKEEEVKVIQEMKIEVEATVMKYSSDIEKLSSEISDLQKVAEEKNSELVILQNEIRNLKSSLTKYCKENDMLESELSNLQHLVQSKENEVAKTKQEKDDINAELLKLQKVLVEKDIEMSNIKQQNEATETDSSQYCKEIEVLEKDVYELKTLLENKELELKIERDNSGSKVTEECDSLNRKLQELQDMLELKEKELNCVKESSHKMEANYMEGLQEIDKLSKKSTDLEDALAAKRSELEYVVSQHRTELDEASRSLSESKQLNDAKCAEVNNALAELQRIKANAEREMTERLRLADERFGAKRESMADELVNVTNASAETEAALGRARAELEAMKAAQADYAKVKLECGELLGEMHEMNQELKQRGETISKLKEYSGELDSRLRDAETGLGAALQDVQCRDKELAAVREENATLAERGEAAAEEAGRLRNRVHQLEREMRDHGDTASEAMSCSTTLSRADEHNRLTEVEDSFEERYTKLRVVAVRLKKRNVEMAQQAGGAEAERGRLAAEVAAKCAQLAANAKNVQNIQQEYDRVQDSLDSQAKELKSVQKLLEASVNESTSVKEAHEQLKEASNELSARLESASKSNKVLEAKVAELLATVKSLTSDRAAQDLALAQARADLDRGEGRLREEAARAREAEGRLEAARQEAKANGVRCLEMDDYERAAAELGAQLGAEKAKVAELTSRHDDQREIAAGLHDQIRLMEESLAVEQSRSGDVIEQLNVLRSRLSDATSAASEREAELHRLRGAAEDHRGAAEAAAVQLAQLAAERLRGEEAGRHRAEALATQVRHLEDRLRDTTAQLSDRTAELAQLAAEFDGYKVRARSVLRQKAEGAGQAAQGGVGGDGGCGEEMAQLRHTAEAARAKLEETRTQLESTSAEAGELRADRERVLAECRSLSERADALASLNEQLADKGREAAAEHRDAAGRQKVHHEILVQSYKTRLDEAEERHAGEKAELKDRIAVLEAKVRLGGADGRVHARNKSWDRGGTAFVPVQLASEGVAMQEREEGEGSESVDSMSPHLTSPKDRHELVPLDKLLSSSSYDGESVVAVSPRADAARLAERLDVSERQVRHLSALLAEAEQDLARHDQLSAVLKEEIRRQKRCEEREQHAHNQEYLKNVVLKFVTLQGGDERSRLVPVLNTILKLSPEEANQLTAVAKGGGEAAGGGKGWGSYLGL